MTSVTDSRQDDQATLLSLLRRFHFGEPSAAAETVVPDGATLPALLHPYRDASTIRYEYPLYLAPADAGADTPVALALTDLLAASVEAFAPGEDNAKILKDNLPWLERYFREALTGPDLVDARGLFDEAAALMPERLGLTGEGGEALQGHLAALRKAFHEGSHILGYGPDAPLHLLVHAIERRGAQLGTDLQADIEHKMRAVEALLQVEAAKGDGAAPAGAATDLLDAGKLADLLKTRAKGSVAMDDARRARLENALAVLRAWQADPVLVRLVGQVDNPHFDELKTVDIVASEDPCERAAELFVQDAARYAELFAALRIAALEIDDRYDPAIHDSWFAGFDWQAFSDEELQHVPRIVARVSADYLACEGLPAFSRLLGSRMPVHIVSWVRAYDNPGAVPGDGPFDAYRVELAYFGVGHRQVVVSQASAARHADMLAGFQCALECNRTSLHLINRGTQTQAERPILDPWFVASAALESRAHPFLLVNPDAGDHAAERIRFDGNPQAENDWPVETLTYTASDGEQREMELAFTFADYALLMPTLHEHFRVVPSGFESPDLVPVADYLAADAAASDRQVPFVWGIDEAGELVRLVISRALCFACRDRLNYWHTLQELAGVHNFYVEAAVERVLEDARSAAEAERDEMLKAHAQELEEARSEAAGEAMGQLVDVLMGADLSSMVGEVAPATMPAPSVEAEEPAAAEAEPEAETVVEEEDDVSFDEPWLDSESCTTCDDCININKQMFAYNADKQAYLKDARAGTYADLVKAAEICPAKCIHPGKPLDPNEPGLDDLMARAAPFN
jgi:ferredoxin